jgi:ferredoxin
MFADVLPLIVKPDETETLVALSERQLSVVEISQALNLPLAAVQSKIDALYRRGFLSKKRNGETRYSARPFERIISRHLGEGRAGTLGRYMIPLADYRMDEHAKRAKSDPYPEGKILPTLEAVIEPVSVVLPHETAMNILSKARSVSLRDCECRTTFRNCAKPLRTCLAIGEFSDELVERGVAVKISLNEAKAVLRTANEHGLVNQALYTDWIKGEVFDICSCCPCCCTYLRTLMKYGVRHHIAGSGFLAEVCQDECSGCGVCVDRCIFGARKIENGKSVVIKENCYGCGLCTTTCVSGASRLLPSNGAGDASFKPRI